ncbi:hypothetical protein [Roseinatronobacter sp. NSM]|uniref:hypothetical protein n=1 Tax=Roseinatronobacter sp. NSM TaxID=3457785 RepID=UPI00403567F7
MAHYPLDIIPQGSVKNKIIAVQAKLDGRNTLRISLDEDSRLGKFGVDFVDKPSFLLLPYVLEDGVIEIDLCARLLPDAPEYARGFIGIAYRVQSDLSAYESIYIRPANGICYSPAPPRNQRGIQYYSFPDWPFDTLREEDPGRYEAAADIALNRWHNLKIELRGRNFKAMIDGALTMEGEGKVSPAAGQIGLWVDIGTDGFFENLRIDNVTS